MESYVINLAINFAQKNPKLMKELRAETITIQQAVEDISKKCNFLTKEMWERVIRTAMFCG